jgi:hypothetical protein
MERLCKLICLGLFATMLLPPVLAQPAGGGAQRMQGGGINYAPQPAVYVVGLVDVKNRTVGLRAADGKTGTVHVGESVYDLSKLKPGDKIRVDFIQPDAGSTKLSAASIWPAQ